MKYFVRLFNQNYAAGDMMCLYSCCRTFIKTTGHTVYVPAYKDVVEAYKDDRFRHGFEGVYFVISAFNHRGKQPLGYYNYLGTFLAAMGLLTESSPTFDFPTFEIPPGTEQKALIQPFSNFAENPPHEYIQSMVDAFIEQTGMKLYAVGKPDTPQTIKNVDYSLLKDGIAHTMKLVQNASFVLTPRSMTAHLAAGYRVPTFVWCPSDGENWHLNYDYWPNKRFEFKKGLDSSRHQLIDFLKEHNVGAISSVG